MQTTCLYCGLPTKITPDKPRCTECGGDLEALITPTYAVGFYYERAQEQAFQGDAKQALSTIRQGLNETDSSDLHLLAAILHQRMGEHDQMRAHVAAIPIDDVLRPEGEWLLRSHQARQAGSRRRVQTHNDALAMTSFGQIGKEEKRQQSRGRRPVWMLPVAVALLLAVAGWWGWQSGALTSGLQQLGMAGIPGLTQSSAPVAETVTDPVTDPVTEPVAEPVTEPVAEPAAQVETAPAEVVLPTPTPAPTTPPPADVVQAAPVEASSVAVQPTAAVTETETETEIGTAVVVAEASPEPSPVASSDQGNVVAIAESAELDLAELLRQLGEADLAELPVTASRSGGEVQLTGTVPTAAQRTRIIDTLAGVPGVAEVDALNLVVRVEKSYTTKAGDNLWRIAEAQYGDGRRWQEIYDLNRSLLGNNPGAIFTNMELQLPPMQ